MATGRSMQSRHGKKGPSERIAMNLALKVETADRLRVLAEAEELPISALIRRAIHTYLTAAEAAE